MWQDDAAQHRRRVPRPQRRVGRTGRHADHRPRPGAGHGLPTGRPLRVAERRPERGVRAPDEPEEEVRDEGPGQWPAQHGRPHGLRRQSHLRTLGWHAAAGGAGPMPGQRARGHPDGRTAGRARRPDPGEDAGPDPQALEGDGKDHHPGHPQRRRGPVPRRQVVRDGPTPGPHREGLRVAVRRGRPLHRPPEAQGLGRVHREARGTALDDLGHGGADHGPRGGMS